jgi:hypothetical protein
MFNFFPLAGSIFETLGIEDETNATMDSLQGEADLAKRNAQNAKNAGQYNARRQQDEYNMLRGQQVATAGASGTEIESGNIFDLLRQSHTNAELDRQAILHDADLQYQNYMARARGLEADRQSVSRGRGNRKAASLLRGFADTVTSSAMMGYGGGSDPAPKLSSTGSAPSSGTYTRSQPGGYISGGSF